MAISEAEKARRRMAWEDICGSFALEGLYPSERTHELARMYNDGLITSEQLIITMKREYAGGGS